VVAGDPNKKSKPCKSPEHGKKGITCPNAQQTGVGEASKPGKKRKNPKNAKNGFPPGKKY